jgi:hypothetical protein
MGSIILKWIIGKYDLSLWNRFISHRIMTSDKLHVIIIIITGSTAQVGPWPSTEVFAIPPFSYLYPSSS